MTKKFSELLEGRTYHFITVHRPFRDISFVRVENVIETTAEEVLPLLPAGEPDAAAKEDDPGAGDQGGGEGL